MFLADYHIHSKYSFDGHEEIAAICEEAILRGMQEIAITDHYDFFTDQSYRRPPDCAGLFDEIARNQERYRDRLIVRAGIEIGQPQAAPAEYEQFLADYPLDFIIGSIHNLEDAYDVGEYDFRKVQIKELYPVYLEALMKMTAEHDFDVCGHITYPMRYVSEQFGEYPDTSAYLEQIRELYRSLIERGKGIEVNASGFFQRMQCAMPDLALVKLYRECGGEIITVGCDAHYLKHVGCSIKLGQNLLKEAGFSYVTTFAQRKPAFHKI